MGSDLDVRNVPAAPARRRLTPRSGLDRLSAEEVRCLAQRIEAGRAARDQLEGNETFDLAARRRLSAVAADGDEARSRLIAGNLRLVYSIARRYRHLPFDDAVAEGTVGLIKAADRFDWRKGFKFSTYATYWIRQAIGSASESIDPARLIRRPDQTAGDALRVYRAIDDVVRLGGEANVTVAALAEATGLPPGRVRRAVETPTCDSIDRARTPSGLTLADVTAGADPDPSMHAVDQDTAAQVRLLVESLPDRHAAIVRLVYGLDTGEPMSVHAAARAAGVPKSTASSWVKAALEALREAAAEAELRDVA